MFCDAGVLLLDVMILYHVNWFSYEQHLIDVD